MAKYSVPFETRTRGAIGIFETRTYTVDADDEEKAREAAFAQAQAEGYETRGSGTPRLVDGGRNPEFLAAIADLNDVLRDTELKPVPKGDKREAAIAHALRAMAAANGVTLTEPLHIDARGEFALIAKPSFGPVLAKYLNAVGPRTGISPGAHMDERSCWCYLNHFAAEQMIRNYDERGAAP